MRLTEIGLEEDRGWGVGTANRVAWAIKKNEVHPSPHILNISLESGMDTNPRPYIILSHCAITTERYLHVGCGSNEACYASIARKGIGQ
jgi:hypothetical protein